MATKRTRQVPERIPTHLNVGKVFFKEALTVRIRLGEEILTRQIQTREQLDQVEKEVSDWDDYNSELLKQSFNNEHNEYKHDYDQVNSFYGFYDRGRDKNVLQQFQEKLDNKITNLKQLLAKVDLIKSEVPDEEASITEISESEGGFSKNIFIVHGHNNEIKVMVARTLEKLGLNPIILHEQANAGKTIIEKFEEHSNVGFAIILLTDDDLGKSKKDEILNSRARQNVILELGYFIGKLGRNRVCPLYTKGVELPSDLYGLLYLEIDSSGQWVINLARELKAAEYKIDANKII
jgi:predicted nucleotide-binding protein